MTETTTPETFDLIIVGSGSGNSIPEYLSDWRIALVERDTTFGGTCLNRGCIPSKMFVLPADVAEAARHGERLGVHTEFHGVDWPAIRDRVFGRIDPIAAGGRDYRATGTPNVTLIEGTARFLSERELDVDGRHITAPRILLAAGARPSFPPIEGLETVGYHTSDTIMRLDRLPNRMGIIGGGFIAVEMGHVFSGFGTKVSMFVRGDRLLRHFDLDIATRFTEVFSERVDLHLNHVPTRIVRNERGAIDIHCAGEIVEVDELLVATGRIPNSDLLDAEAAGLPMHHGGRIVVDDTMATPVEGIWAIGDVSNGFQLKHLANAEAAVAFWNIAHSDTALTDDLRRVDTSAVPAAVFSDPQVATVGLTEAQAEARGIPFTVGRRDYGGTAYGWALEDETSFAKVLVHAETGLIIGAHILGPQAATLIQPLIQAMTFGQTAQDVATKVFYIHPALTEVVENALLDAGVNWGD